MNQHMPGVRIAFAAFLDNLSGAALFGKLRWPGAPSEMIDSRTVEEDLASGESRNTWSASTQARLSAGGQPADARLLNEESGELFTAADCFPLRETRAEGKVPA